MLHSCVTRIRFFLALAVAAFVWLLNPLEAPGNDQVEADLLIIGGTESACAAAVQAARMGVNRILLVNDIEWLGGQFSAEALMAIDENTYKTGVRHDQPIPRHGAFKEVIDRIEADNLKKYGVARPGNTRVITTCRPADAERVFREWLAPYVRRGQIDIRSWYEPAEVKVADGRVSEVVFHSRRPLEPGDARPPLRVRAKLTIDASDWGDVIRLSGADYEFGPDLKEKYGEPLAPKSREGYPVTDMNPITYCTVIVETDEYKPISPPANYDPRNYFYQFPETDDPLWLYGSRRIIDHYHFQEIDHPDVVLLCYCAFDYPLDTHPQAVADALEATEQGASAKNIVQLTPVQRQIVLEDAKQHTLGFLYYLQTQIHERMADKTHSFRRFQLTDEFGTPDKMPFKPYVRESLRMKAMYMMRQQDTTGVRGESANFASAMYHDGIAVWQFEYDFHPTKRVFIDGDPAGPWYCDFRADRTWGPPYSGRSLFALRSLIPEKLDGLLGAQKNLGFSSLVSSAVRLHDQSMAIGQASGASAAVALNRGIQPRDIPFDRNRLMEVQLAIASPHDGGEPSLLWPYKDLDSSDPSVTAVNMLSVQGCLPIQADEIYFYADHSPSPEWMQSVVQRTREQLQAVKFDFDPPFDAKTRGEFARRWWELVRAGPWKPYTRKTANDADGDGIADRDDGLPLDPLNGRPPIAPLPPDVDGLPDDLPDSLKIVKQFNFAPQDAPVEIGFTKDYGEIFSVDQGHGWQRDLTQQNRWRSVYAVLPDTYMLTRTHDIWECELPNGKYVVDLSIGDSAHEQFGQNVTVEDVPLFRDVTTPQGRFAEKSVQIEVRDGRLTLEIGLEGSQTNTCLNWLRVAK